MQDSAAPNGATTIYLIRHGETWLNVLDRVQGWSDSPLTQQGEKQAFAAGRGLADQGIEFVSLYSADMLRHAQTATFAAEGAGQGHLILQRRPGLRELAFGKYEGLRNKKLWRFLESKMVDPENSSVAQVLDNCADELSDAATPAETATECSERMKRELPKIAGETEETGGGNVLVCSSGLSILLALAAIQKEPAISNAIRVPNCSVSTLIYGDGELTMTDFNSTAFRDAFLG